MNFFKLKNPIQNYAWGSKTAIQDLFGIENPNQEPQAEIWMGAHPNGCSHVQFEGKEILLSEFINQNKIQILSLETDKKFGELPYLFKVLAAGQALSIQVHPSKKEAEEGFAIEEELGIERSALNRNFKDANHKPELVYALTSYQAMNGFRLYNDIVFLFSQVVEHIDLCLIRELLQTFRNNMTPKGLETFFIGILSLDGKDKELSIQGLVEYAKTHQFSSVEIDLSALILQLNKSYPGDIGLFAPLMLNVLTLAPGEAMYLDSRTPHAYLKGTGLEVMANSDNVLRAGLTTKNINLSELARCTSFDEKPFHSLKLKPKSQGDKQSYLTTADDFRFEVFHKATDELILVNSAEIVFAISGDVKLTHRTGEILVLEKGESVFIPAYVEEYKISSIGSFSRVYNN
ncbi:mannose-6-phosphate isomerase, class I [Vibrio owensii]|uniref:mannose-6-phosphate isomerase, class I n=1 Tax=Vibrio owensii TaxID=696485 RepID=UPI003DA0B739